MLAPGTTIQRYVVEALIGSGGMGSVYRARDTQLDRPVALKVLATTTGAATDSDREARERLVREARAVAALSHPNAVTIYDAGDSDHGPFIVMELVEGETLRQAIDRHAPATDVLPWMKMAALALGEAHDRGIVHRDVKPENLMLRRDGIAKVLDFGIARAAKSPLNPMGATETALPTLTGTGIQIGTPQYMAPEQIKGKKLDGRADQFSWAVTAYEALSGRLPWDADAGALSVVAAILEETPPDVSTLRSDVPPHVGAAIARAMAKRTDDRFPTMRDLVRALDGLEPLSEGSPDRVMRAPAPRSPSPHLQPIALSSETRFGEGTVKAVIGRALAFEEKGGYSKSELSEAAREIGISEAALEEATNAIRGEKKKTSELAESDAIAARIIQRRRRGFRAHLIAYIGVNLIILMPFLAKGMFDKIWAGFVPAIAWGIGLAIHAMHALSREVDPREIKRQLLRDQRGAMREAAQREVALNRVERRARRDRMKKHALEIGGAVEHGVESFLESAARELRGSGRPPSPKPVPAENRVRVAEPTPPERTTSRAEAEQEAEAEADAARAARANQVRAPR